jgi:hypothetical protein
MAYSSITKPEDYFNTTIWSGNNTSPRTITTNVDNDLVWVKNRSHAYSHYLLDSVRGVGTSSDGKQLRSDSTSANITATTNGYISGLSNTGFTLTTGSSDFERLNANGMTYCAWTWRANGAGSANTDGSINTTATSVNTTAGFSIVKWTGSGANATVGHGLGVAPKMIILKNTSEVYGWQVYHASLGNTKYLSLNSTDAEATSSQSWNNTSPTSTVFSVGASDSNNKSGNTIIAYCFAEKQGYSKFGSYKGNGNVDGTFIYTGFKPAFILSKKTNALGTQWTIWDNKRSSSGGGNAIDKILHPNVNNPVNTADDTDFLSNGFKLRATASGMNNSGDTYIYMAIAEEPLVANSGSNGIPATAR